MTSAATKNWVLIMAAFGGMVVSIIASIRNGSKIDVVKELADGNLSRVSNELRIANELATKNAERVSALEKLIMDSKPKDVHVVNPPTQPVPTVTLPK